MIVFHTFDEIGAARWDHVVCSSPDGWAYATAAWRQIILNVAEWGLEDCSFGVCGDGRILGVLPLQYQRASRRMASTGWGSGGPIVAGDIPRADRAAITATLLARAETLAREHDAVVLEITTQPVTRSSLETPSGVNPFTAFGFEDCSTQARVADLSRPSEALWSALSRNARQMVRKAERAGYTAARMEWSDLLEDYYRVHVETYRRTGTAPHPKSYFEGIARHLAPAGYSVLWAGIAPDGRPVAFHNDTRFNGASLYHTGCSETDHLESGVNYLVFWAAILGAQRDGCSWYEIGDVFPEALDGKRRGLTVFKSKFGGNLHRSFRARRVIPPRETTPESEIRSAYRESDTYSPSRICRRVDRSSDEYADRLLQERVAIVSELNSGGVLVDLCCASGTHLIDLAKDADRAIGVDFTARYLADGARAAAAEGKQNVSFVQADARSLPLTSGSVDCLYCFSSLYAIPRAEEVVAEVGRVLAPGGRAVLDFGNRRSLNAFCVRYYTEWPSIYPLTLSEMRRAIARAGLAIERHRRFQLLPLWADRPAWLWPLLHPGWKRVFRTRVFGKMTDEWASSLPGLRAFAFRHVIVCRKSTAQA